MLKSSTHLDPPAGTLPGRSLLPIGLAVLMLGSIVANAGSPLRTIRIASPILAERWGLRTTALSDSPVEVILLPGYLLLTVVFCLAAILVRVQRPVRPLITAVLALGAGVAATSLVSFHPLATLNDAWAIGVSVPCATIFAQALVVRHSEQLLSRSLLVAILGLLLLVTVLRIPYGAFDRNAPFFVCGPIVWGWLMGIGILCLLHARESLSPIPRLLAAVALNLGILMSGSRGPLVASVVAALFLAWRSRQFLPVVRLAVLGVMATAAGLLLTGIAKSLAEDALSSPIPEEDALSSPIPEVDMRWSSAGHSISTRWRHLELVVPYSAKTWLLGQGPRHFGAVEPTGTVGYPHNVFLEILDSYGAVAALLFLSLLIVAIVRAGPLVGSLCVLFSCVLCLSGDLSYVRYLLPWILLGLARLPTEDGAPATPATSRLQASAPD